MINTSDKALVKIVKAGLILRDNRPSEAEVEWVDASEIFQSDEGRILIASLDHGEFREKCEAIRDSWGTPMRNDCEFGVFLADLCGSAFSDAALRLHPELRELNSIEQINELYDAEDRVLLQNGGEYLVDCPARFL